MSPVIVLILLISTMSCCAAPSPGNDHCQKPDPVDGAQLQGEWNEETYPPGKVANFACPPGYIQDGPIKMACIEGTWWQIAKGQCKGLGSECGPPPHVQYGDTLGIQKSSYKSGESVTYKCPQYYILNGDINVQCLHGVWGEAPECLEPCTANERVMKQYNLELRWTSDKKLYSLHDDLVEFRCTFGYEVLPDTQMRVRCERGMLEYPKCYKKGFCVLQQPTMMANNIIYNVSTVVDDGQTIVFQCNEGMTPETQLQAKCENQNINYPRCTSAKSCKNPTIQNGFIKTAEQPRYDSGSYVDYECNKDYVLYGRMSAKCVNGEWEDLPVCYAPCKILVQKLEKHNIRLLDAMDKMSHTHGTELRAECRPGFKHPVQTALAIECIDGMFRYPTCFSGPTCRMDQDQLDENNLELDEVHESAVYYGEGAEIRFKCKAEFKYRGQPTGKCSQKKITYPKCEGFCVLQQPTMMANNIIYNVSTVVDDGQTIVFQCNEGMTAETQLQAKCENQNINYPRCTSAKSCKNPTIQNGFIKTAEQPRYDSGSYVEFECNKDYVLYGRMSAKCVNGEWEDLPVCYAPCKILVQKLEKHKIRLLDAMDKMSHTHGTELRAECRPGFKHPVQTALAIECIDGMFRYPTCFSGPTCRMDQDQLDENNLELDEVHESAVYYGEGAEIRFKCKAEFKYRGQPTGKCSQKKITYPKCEGFCVLQQPTMMANNIIYNVSTVVDDGQTIVFQCNEGMTAETQLQAKCENQNINYPRCTSAKSCKNPTIQNGFIKTAEQPRYDSGSYVEFECNKDYVLYGRMSAKCVNGEWEDLPVCYAPCKILVQKLEKHKIRLLDAMDKMSHTHGTELRAECRPGFKHPVQTALAIECIDGMFRYPTCFSGPTCRMDQDQLDENNLELDEVHESAVYYGEGAEIRFKCKAEFKYRGQPTGKCSQKKITYPKCEGESSV
ncbi:complement factor H-related protein 5-like isoform X2 [Engystomops pustulosus]|uniref:complement factor H-related protein 5-like isoform X2 n=1 Tax=Engystomops pustulosus TaxID=76066 RepID=UPI003AFAECA6